VAREVADGTLGGDFDRADRADIQSKVTGAEDAAKDEVCGGYRFAVIADLQESDGLKSIDLGAGHSSSGETLCGRVISALKSEVLLNESVGAGYIDRNWPPALKESGAWPLASLRQSFLNGCSRGCWTRIVSSEAGSLSSSAEETWDWPRVRSLMEHTNGSGFRRLLARMRLPSNPGCSC